MANDLKREHWGGPVGFILATAGAAIGVGNIWRFPYVTGENGGGAFVLVYLAMTVLMGLPLLLCEMALGRRTQMNAVSAFRVLRPVGGGLGRGGWLLSLGVGTGVGWAFGWGWGLLGAGAGCLVLRMRWATVGLMATVSAFLILSYYSVVGGWTLLYMGKAITGGLAFAGAAEAQAAFEAVARSPGLSARFHLLFMGMTMAVVYTGVRNGVERWSKVLLPALFAILLALVVRAVTLPGAMAGVRFYLAPDFSKITGQTLLVAMGQSFYSLSLAMGISIVYGSYLRRDVNLFRAAGAVIGLDTLVALLAGLVVFPAVFAFGMEPAAGTGLVFRVLPTVFGQMPMGTLWAFLFFALLLVAAWTSAIALLETVVSAAMDEWGWARHQAVLACGGGIAALGVLSAVSVSGWEKIEGLRKALATMFGEVPSSFFDMMDAVTANWLLMIGGLGTCVFVGWVWGTRAAAEELREGMGEKASRGPWIRLWAFFVRAICPLAILAGFLHAIGALGP